MKLLPDTPAGGRWRDAATLSAFFEADVMLGRVASERPSLVPMLARRLLARRRAMEAERARQRERGDSRYTLRDAD